MKSFKFIYVLILIVAFSACNKDEESSITEQEEEQEQQFEHDPTAFAQNFGEDISRTVFGNIMDNNSNPLSNVLVTIGNQTTMTDSNGVFIMQDATFKEQFGYVTAEKSGFIHASRALVPSEGTNKVTIMMLPETIVGSTSSGTQKTIALADGTSVSLEGEYIKEDGSNYTGNVNVIIHHLDPEDENIDAQMPGMLYAANAQNEERVLQTFGMLAIELRGDNGEDLNIAEGSSAEIRVPVDPSLISEAPSTIPLWHFDEANGYWIEDGQATLVGNQYLGTVTHFSFWNCSSPANAAKLCVIVNDSDGNPIANVVVGLFSPSFGAGFGNTNEDGETCGLIPADVILYLNVYVSSNCNQGTIYSETIGPFTEDSNITLTIADSPDILVETVTGTFNDCDDNPVSGGYVLLTIGSQIFRGHVTNGEFEINLMRCESETTFAVQAFDYINFQETDILNYTFISPLTDLGTIKSCNAVEEFVQYTIDGTINVFVTEIDYARLSFLAPNNDPFLKIRAEIEYGCIHLFQCHLEQSPYIGSYSVYNPDDDDSLGFSFGINTFGGPCPELIRASYSPSNEIVYNVTKLGEVGEYIDINFSGTYEDLNGIPHTTNGVIHVLRTQ